jgi:BlaI family penicillinase repressor
MKLSDSEWAVMEVLWAGEAQALGAVTEALQPVLGWNKNTVYTYLQRMGAKGLVTIRKGESHPYSAALSREECARKERDDLLNKVYGGAAGDLIAAFLKDSALSPEEAKRLRALLDNMEV